MKYAYLVGVNSPHGKDYLIRCDAAKIREALAMHSQVGKAKVTVNETTSPPRWKAGDDVFDQYSEDDFKAGLFRKPPVYFCFSDAPKQVKVMRSK